ncbi:MAG: AAA family ATPase [Moraxellaceae bacterium]|nr:AAA family ATPase [Moraxellaceae bacterium]
MRLKVQNFVCLQDVDVELNDITFFIGEQASGKSLLCKLYFYVREVLKNEFIDTLKEEDASWSFFIKKMRQQFYILFPSEYWVKNSFFISILNEQEKTIISIENRNTDLNFFFDESIKINLQSVALKYKEIQANSDDGEGVTNFLKQSLDVIDMLGKVIYIPSGRAYFSTVSENPFTLLLNNNSHIDIFIRNFGAYYETSKRFHRLVELDTEPKSDSFIYFDKLATSILKGKYQVDKKDQWIIDNNQKIALAYTSSGQQEVLPLLLILKMRITDISSYSLIVEEPEAHLFPTSQKAIIDLLFLVISTSVAKAKMLVTTHSPYILSCANNALLKNPDIKVNAYYLANGTAKRIMDDEVGLIDGIDLDGVSYQIAEEFDELLAKSDSHG